MNPVHVKAELARSTSSLRSAEILLEARLFPDAVSRSYYAVMHAARAALLFHEVIAESHTAVRRLFGLTLVRPGLIERQWARILEMEQDRRIQADYDVHVTWDQETVSELVRDAATFLARIRTHLQSSGFED